jgi:hypothetical protein
VGDSLRFASGHKLSSCIHQVVPFEKIEYRYSIVYFLRPKLDVLWKDSEGRFVTVGQWHDEKYEVFSATHEMQKMAVPKTMLLSSMPEQLAQIS